MFHVPDADIKYNKNKIRLHVARCHVASGEMAKIIILSGAVTERRSTHLRRHVRLTTRRKLHALRSVLAPAHPVMPIAYICRRICLARYYSSRLQLTLIFVRRQPYGVQNAVVCRGTELNRSCFGFARRRERNGGNLGRPEPDCVRTSSVTASVRIYQRPTDRCHLSASIKRRKVLLQVISKPLHTSAISISSRFATDIYRTGFAPALTT